MSSQKVHIDSGKLPRHIAIIMDGNGRWAQQLNQPRIFGHQNGVKAVREATEACAELGIPYLTLYAFSTENWSRPEQEVDALMALLVETVFSELSTLTDNQIRLQAIGDISQLPEKTRSALLDGIERTKDHTRMTLVLALNYSGRWEITQAMARAAGDAGAGVLAPEQVTEELVASYLSTAGMPDPELLIRTSGECRISNFLLWQIAYAELIFLPIFWPEFTKESLYEAVLEYQKRERRFGLISEQINTQS